MAGRVSVLCPLTWGEGINVGTNRVKRDWVGCVKDLALGPFAFLFGDYREVMKKNPKAIRKEVIKRLLRTAIRSAGPWGLALGAVGCVIELLRGLG